MNSAIARLPIPLPPLSNETLDSYLPRLAQRNYLARSGGLFKLRGTELRLALHQLTGVSDIGLATALPQVRFSEDRERWPHLNLAVSARAPIRPACRLCAATRGTGSDTKVFASHEQVICQQHRRWVGAGILKCSADQQFSIAPVGEVSRANVRHQHLIKTYGRGSTHQRFHDAVAALMHWHDWPIFARDPRIQQRRNQLRIQAASSTRDPRDVAAWYPNAVAFTALLLSYDRASEGHTGMQRRETLRSAVDRFELDVVVGLRPSGATSPFIALLLANDRQATTNEHAEVEVADGRRHRCRLAY
ncbi:TniQ protein [Williamsia maris]|uniref:TniQ protein n=1 Tax=Williamsia maris TaxID=72806 RepID=A0ABT1HJL4_9NOCA|nr:TniQ protein [Williamsia maris]